MSFLAFILLAAAPDIPIGEVQIIVESGQYVMRTLPGGLPLYTFDRDEPASLTAPVSASPRGRRWPLRRKPSRSASGA